MYKEMPNNLQRWEKTRQKGKTKFMLQNGLLAWGLPMFIVVTFVVSRIQRHQLTPALIVADAFIWALAGLIYGWAIWRVTEKKYQKFIAQSNATQRT